MNFGTLFLFLAGLDGDLELRLHGRLAQGWPFKVVRAAPMFS